MNERILFEILHKYKIYINFIYIILYINIKYIKLIKKT